MRYAWLTDIHLEFLQDCEAVCFVEELAAQRFDGLFLTGDISNAVRLEYHLQLFEEFYRAPVYFVLGNHDYYGDLIENVRKNIEKLCNESKWIKWLPALGVVQLSGNTCLVGHDSWADGRLGNYEESRVVLTDYLKIKDFIQVGGVGRLALLHSLGDQAAEYFGDILSDVLSQYEHVIVLTHVPPFEGSCWHDGEISAEDWLPHFACKAVGDVLKDHMIDYSATEMTVLCGHTHSSGVAEILPNLRVKTGRAEYGHPEIQEIIEL